MVCEDCDVLGLREWFRTFANNVEQVRPQNFFYWGGGAEPEAVYNLIDLKNML
jgi:hypothetical protein